MKWRAQMDGSTLESGPRWGRSTEEIDRARLETFEVFATDTALSPVLSVRVPRDAVMVARQRTFMASNGGKARVALVALETRQGELLTLWEVPEGGVPVLHRDYGGPGLWPPERNESER